MMDEQSLNLRVDPFWDLHDVVHMAGQRPKLEKYWLERVERTLSGQEHGI